MFDTVFFDMDGTLNDSFEGITHSVEYALKKMGIAPPADRRELSCFIGPPLVESFARYYDLSDADARLAVKYYREYYVDKGIFDNRVYDGVPQMLEALNAAGKKLVLATSKPEPAAVRIIDHFDLRKYFTYLAGATLDDSRINKDEVIEYALKATGANAASTVMVGDRHHDIEGARIFGLKSIGVLYGYGSKAELTAAGADYIAATPDDVVKIILN